MLSPILIWLSCLLLVVQCAEPYPKPDELCVVACALTLSKQSFSGEAANDTAAQACENTLYIQSMYLCAQEYCPEGDVEPGIAYQSLVCRIDGLPSLPPASIAANVSLQDAKPINATSKGKKLNHTVIATQEFFDLSYNSSEYRARGMYSTWDFQQAIFIYWGIVLGLAIVANLTSTVFAAKWPPKPLAKATHAVQAHVSIPQLLPKQSYPGTTRLEALIILGFSILSIVLCGVKIEAFRESTIYASFELQVWGLVSRRLGNIATAQIPLIWVFSMRNSPLIWATGWSFATFNQFHRWIARITVLELIGHAIAFTKFEFIKGGSARYVSMYSKDWWVWGVVATVAFAFLLVFSIPVLRYRFYNLFLLMHIALAVVAFVGTWYHLETWYKYFNGYLWPVIAVWVLERLLRIVRVVAISAWAGKMGKASLSWDETANIVRIDATNIMAKLKPKAGEAYYLYTPTRFPFYPSHPFTLAVFPNDSTAHTPLGTSQNSNEKVNDEKNGNLMVKQEKSSVTGAGLNYRFLIRPGDGFTRRLQRFAALHGTHDKAQMALPLLIEGPYSSGNASPEKSGCKSILILAGGSGISVAVGAIQRALATSKSDVAEVRLVWAVRRLATVHSLAREELRVFLLDPRFTMECFVTNTSLQNEAGSETALVTSTSRPDVNQIIRGAVADSTDTVGVVVCGPQGMTVDARKAVSSILREGKENVKLFVENFGW
ncbi:unnamed protein product [Discula destructiva]